MNPTTPTPIPAPTLDEEALETRAARRERRAQRQLLDHYRDLQAALHALSKDYGMLGIDLPYTMTFTKSFSAQAYGGPPVKAVLSLTLSEISCPEPGHVANHKGRKSRKECEAGGIFNHR